MSSSSSDPAIKIFRDIHITRASSRKITDDMLRRVRHTSEANIKSVDNERDLRFYLRSPQEFQEFVKAVTVDLTTAEFFDPTEDASSGSDENR